MNQMNYIAGEGPDLLLASPELDRLMSETEHLVTEPEQPVEIDPTENEGQQRQHIIEVARKRMERRLGNQAVHAHRKR
jgi:hypothetical protein